MRSLTIAWLFYLVGGVVYCQNSTYELPIVVGTFEQQYHSRYTTKEGLPANEVKKIGLSQEGRIIAETSKGLAEFSGDNFQSIKNTH